MLFELSLAINRTFGYHSIHNSIGYLLSDAGYDVWLGNYRGNTYSKSHCNLTADDEAFWKFR